MKKKYQIFNAVLSMALLGGFSCQSHASSISEQLEMSYYLGAYHADFCREENLTVDQAIERVHFAKERGDFVRFFNKVNFNIYEGITAEALLREAENVGGHIFYPIYVKKMGTVHNRYYLHKYAPVYRYSEPTLVPDNYEIKSFCLKKVDDACSAARFKALKVGSIDLEEYFEMVDENKRPVLSSQLQYLHAERCE